MVRAASGSRQDERIARPGLRGGDDLRGLRVPTEEECLRSGPVGAVGVAFHIAEGGFGPGQPTLEAAEGQSDEFVGMGRERNGQLWPIGAV